MTTRWILHDAVASETWTVPINPDSMTSVEPTKNVRFARGRTANHVVPDPRSVSFLSKPSAREWQFGGAIRTQEHYESFETWVAKTNEIEITDHLGRTFQVYLTAFKPAELAHASKRLDWRMRYTVTALILQRLS